MAPSPSKKSASAVGLVGQVLDGMTVPRQDASCFVVYPIMRMDVARLLWASNFTGAQAGLCMYRSNLPPFTSVRIPQAWSPLRGLLAPARCAPAAAPDLADMLQVRARPQRRAGPELRG